MKGHAEKCVGRCAELAHKSVDQVSKVSTSRMDDHQLPNDDFEIVGELADVRRTNRSNRQFTDSQVISNVLQVVGNVSCWKKSVSVN